MPRVKVKRPPRFNGFARGITFCGRDEKNDYHRGGDRNKCCGNVFGKRPAAGLYRGQKYDERNGDSSTEE